jgi:hypothetical protein
MAKPKIQPRKPQYKTGKQKKEIVFPLEKSNLMIIGFGILLLIIGYIFMAENSVNGFLPTVAAPILLVLGYCVVIPYGIIKRPKTEVKPVPVASENVSSGSTSSPSSSNIKTK